jgi:hypothetical protein
MLRTGSVAPSNVARPRRARLPSALPLRAPQADPQHQPLGAHLRRAAPAGEGDRPLPRRDLGALPDLGRARAVLARLARRRDDTARGRRDRATPTRPGHRRTERALDRGGDRRLGSRPSGATPGRFHPDAGTPPGASTRSAANRILPFSDRGLCTPQEEEIGSPGQTRRLRKLGRFGFAGKNHSGALAESSCCVRTTRRDARSRLRPEDDPRGEGESPERPASLERRSCPNAAMLPPEGPEGLAEGEVGRSVALRKARALVFHPGSSEKLDFPARHARHRAPRKDPSDHGPLRENPERASVQRRTAVMMLRGGSGRPVGFEWEARHVVRRSFRN